MQSTFVTIDSFDHLTQAEMLLLRLTQEGLDARLADNHIVAMKWLMANAIGGIKVQVPDSQAEQACEIAAELRLQIRARVNDQTEIDDDACLSCGHTIPDSADSCTQCGWSYLDAQE